MGQEGQLILPLMHIVKDTNINLVTTNTTNSTNRVEVGVVGVGWMTETLKCILINARSLLNKKEEIECYVYELRPDLIFVTETWANDEKRE